MTEHTMTIDPQYPYGDYSDAGSEEADKSKEQGAQQKAQGEPASGGGEPASGGGEPSTEQAPEGDPKEAIVALRRENQQLKQQAQYISGVMQQQNQQQNQQQAQPQQGQDPFAKYDEDDVVTVADMKKVMQQNQQAQPQQQPPQQTQPDVREIQMQNQFPDYQQEIQKIPTIIQQNPHLQSAIRNSDDPFMTAYSLAKQFPNQEQPSTGQPNQQGQKVVDNLNKPQSVSQAGGTGAISKANYYAQLDDAKLEAEIAKAKRG